jgi:nucleotide-binding universal stress UspA family protein
MTQTGDPRILVAVDGSDGSLRALDHAANVAAGCGGTLLVLNVQQSITPGRLVSRAMIREYQQKQAKAALRRARARMRRRQVDASFHVVVGEPAPAIARFAKDQGCREIVIGTRGLGKVAGMLLGSVVTKVIHLASCPVTVVK